MAYDDSGLEPSATERVLQVADRGTSVRYDGQLRNKLVQTKRISSRGQTAAPAVERRWGSEWRHCLQEKSTSS